MKRENHVLSLRDRRFLDNVRMGMEESPAARAAGWTKPNEALKKLRKRPEIQAEMANIYRAARRKAQISRDEVLEGLKDAIGDAKLLGDPNAQIKGWSEIGKMCGFYAPEKKEVHLSADQSVLEQQLAGMSTQELLELAGQDSLEVIEGEFERLEDAG